MPVSDLKFNVPMTRLRRLSEVTAEPQEWLWLRVIPRGAVTMITGEEGVGKSLLVTDFAASVTRGDRGPHNASASDPAAVLLMSQGRLDMTARRRLEAARADLSLVYAVEFVPDLAGAEFDQPIMSDFEAEELITSGLTFNDRLVLLEQELSGLKDAEVDVRMIVIDSLAGWAGTASRKCDPHHFAMGLMDLADRFGIAILVVAESDAVGNGQRKFSRSARQAELKQAVQSAAQSVWTIRRDPENLWRRVLLPVKTNLCEFQFGIACSIREGTVQWEHGLVEIPSGHFTVRGWEPTPPVFGNEEFSELSRATAWLRNHLAGKSDFSTTIRADAKEHDISQRTLRRAFRRLNGVHSVDKETGKWLWHLPIRFQSANPATTDAEETDMEETEETDLEETGERSSPVQSQIETNEDPGLPERESHELAASQNETGELSHVGQTWPSTNSAPDTMKQACWPKVAKFGQASTVSCGSLGGCH